MIIKTTKIKTNTRYRLISDQCPVGEGICVEMMPDGTIIKPRSCNYCLTEGIDLIDYAWCNYHRANPKSSNLRCACCFKEISIDGLGEGSLCDEFVRKLKEHPVSWGEE